MEKKNDCGLLETEEILKEMLNKPLKDISSDLLDDIFRAVCELMRRFNNEEKDRPEDETRKTVRDVIHDILETYYKSHSYRKEKEIEEKYEMSRAQVIRNNMITARNVLYQCFHDLKHDINEWRKCNEVVCAVYNIIGEGHRNLSVYDDLAYGCVSIILTHLICEYENKYTDGNYNYEKFFEDFMESKYYDGRAIVPPDMYVRDMVYFLISKYNNAYSEVVPSAINSALAGYQYEKESASTDPNEDEPKNGVDKTRLRYIFEKLQNAINAYPHLEPKRYPDQLALISNLYATFGATHMNDCCADNIMHGGIFYIIGMLFDKIEMYRDSGTFVEAFLRSKYSQISAAEDDAMIFSSMLWYLLNDTDADESIGDAIEELRSQRKL